MNPIKEVIVVEGHHDESRLKQINPNWDIITTNGSEISDETILELKVLQEKRGIIIFTDPDYPGERIRNKIVTTVKRAKHAYISKQKCISENGKKIGVEHAKDIDIIESLEQVITPVKLSNKHLTYNDLFQLKLSGCKDASSNRKKLSDITGIWLGNTKSTLKKLNMFGLDKEEINTLLRR